MNKESITAIVNAFVLITLGISAIVFTSYKITPKIAEKLLERKNLKFLKFLEAYYAQQQEWLEAGIIDHITPLE